MTDLSIATPARLVDDEHAAEFHDAAEGLRAQLNALDRQGAIAAACRGSGNPAWLAWLAEAVTLSERSSVIDVGAGTGGPAAWLAERYRCQVTGVDPVASAASVATTVFGVPFVIADGASLPFGVRAFDVAFGLGVISVVPDPERLIAELLRVADTVACVAYVSTASEPVHAAGSAFPTTAGLEALFGDARATLTTFEPAPVIEAPPTWRATCIETDDDPGAAVTDAIDAGLLAPWIVVAGSEAS